VDLKLHHYLHLGDLYNSLGSGVPEGFTFLPGFTFTAKDLLEKSGQSELTIINVLNSFRAGDHARRQEKIATILNSRFSGERVREIVERLHLAEYSLSEKLAYALAPRANPYHATFGTLSGHTWTGEIICGHNPYLKARFVDDFLIERHDDGKETATWSERPRPVLKT